MNIKNIADGTISLAKKIYGDEFIPLHRPIFEGAEKKSVKIRNRATID